MAAPLLTVVESDEFRKEAGKLMTDEEIADFIIFLAGHPEFGDVIPDTGGVRKIRWAVKGKGKSSGARVIYYFFDETNPIYLFTAYGKGKKSDLTEKEKQTLKKIVTAMKTEMQRKRRVQ